MREETQSIFTFLKIYNAISEAKLERTFKKARDVYENIYSLGLESVNRELANYFNIIIRLGV